MSEIEEKLLNNVDSLIKGYYREHPSYAWDVIIEYYSYLSDNLNFRPRSISNKLLSSYEVVYISLISLLTEYSPSSLNQLNSIENAHKLCDFMTQLATDIESGQFWLKKLSGLRKLVYFPVILVSDIKLSSLDSKLYSMENLSRMKTALNRINHIAKLVYGSIDREALDAGYDDDLSDYAQHFDFTLVNKIDLKLKIEILASEIRSTPDSSERLLLLQKLEKIEAELKEAKTTNWKTVILHTFILIGFLADLKTLKPEIYDKAYEIGSNIISQIHHQGQRENHMRNVLKIGDAPPYEFPKELPNSTAIVPQISLPRKADDE